MWMSQPLQAADFSGFSFGSPTTAPMPNGFICASTSPAFRTPCSTRPSSTPARNWQIYNGPGFTGAVDIPKDVWFHLRLEVAGAQAKLYVKDMDKPALVMNDLKSGVQKGQVALYVLTGATYFSNFEVRTTPDAPWERHLPPMPPGTLTKWSLSPSYDALARNLEHPLSASESDAIQWQDVEAEPPGLCGHLSVS